MPSSFVVNKVSKIRSGPLLPKPVPVSSIVTAIFAGGTTSDLTRSTRARSITAHRFDPVHDEIEHDLLQLNSIGLNRREIRRQFEFRRDLAPLQLLASERQDLGEGVVDVDPGPLRDRLPHQ